MIYSRLILFMMVLSILLFFSSINICAENYETSLKWRKICDMPAARSNVSLVAFEDKIYILGGLDEKGSKANTWEFNPIFLTWNILPDMPTPRYSHNSVIYKNTILVFGGINDSKGIACYPDSIDQFDLKTKKWKTIGKMPAGRARFSSVIFADRIYLIGGADDKNKALSSIVAYNPENNKWENKRNLLNPLNRHCSAVIGNELIVAGGENENGKTQNTVLKYITDKDQWEKISPMNTPRKNFASSILGNSLIISGGWDEIEGKKVFFSKVEVYDPVRKEFIKQDNLNSARDGNRSTAIGGRIFVFGGYNGRLISSVEEGRWVTNKSMWNMEPALKFNLAYYSDNEELFNKNNSYSIKPSGYTSDYTPDITNIIHRNILALGFPLPERINSDKLNFFLKFYQYPQTLDLGHTLKKILSPSLFFNTARSLDLENYLKSRNNTLVKKGFIADSNFPFSAQNPFPPLRILEKDIEFKGIIITPQDFFDDSIPFSSLYVEPHLPVSGNKDDRQIGVKSAEGVVEFHNEILSIFRRSLTEIKSSDSEKTLCFIDNSQCENTLKSNPIVTIYRIPKTPMVFREFLDKPMPQDPRNMFLTGLQLIYLDQYHLKKYGSSKDITDYNSVIKNAQKIKSHLFEIGSVIYFKTK